MSYLWPLHLWLVQIIKTADVTLLSHALAQIAGPVIYTGANHSGCLLYVYSSILPY